MQKKKYILMSKPGLIIGISGKIGTGKDTVAREIIKAFPEFNFRKVSFGYNVKKIVSILTGIDMRTILSRKIKNEYQSEWELTIGEMFQIVGTDAIRDNLSENAWIYSLFNNVKDGENIIITDVRFKNEAYSILNRGGYLIRLTGDSIVDDTRKREHKSETELDNFNMFDIIFENKPPISNIKKLIEELTIKLNL
jgi:hypothetical protein